MIDNLIDWFIEGFLKILMLAFIFFTVIGLPILAYYCWYDFHKPMFSLKKDDWSCTEVYQYTTTAMIMVGKVMVPQTITHNDCIEYKRK